MRTTVYLILLLHFILLNHGKGPLVRTTVPVLYFSFVLLLKHVRGTLVRLRTTVSVLYVLLFCSFAETCERAISKNNCISGCPALKMECGCLHAGVTENGRTGNPLALCSVPVLVQVWVHILGDPQSVQLRNATTTTAAVTYPNAPTGRDRHGRLGEGWRSSDGRSVEPAADG